MKIDDEIPCISKSIIGSLGLSACEVFLFTGLYKNERFSYLNHTAKLFEKDPFGTLGFILDRLQEELGKCFNEFSNDFIFNLNDLHLIVGGGQAKENDILCQACSLLATKDTEALDKLNKYFANTYSHYLYRKVMNNVTILNAVSFPIDEHDEEEVTGMDEDDQDNTVNPYMYNSLTRYPRRTSCKQDLGILEEEFVAKLNVDYKDGFSVSLDVILAFGYKCQLFLKIKRIRGNLHLEFRHEPFIDLKIKCYLSSRESPQLEQIINQQIRRAIQRCDQSSVIICS